MVICCYVAPCIVGVRAYFCSAGVVYRNYVALQILFEVIRYEIIECITLSRREIYTYRATAFVIDKYEYVATPSLRYDSATVEYILIFRSEISSLTRSYSVCIISIVLSQATFLLYCIFDTLSRQFVRFCHNVVKRERKSVEYNEKPHWQRKTLPMR